MANVARKSRNSCQQKLWSSLSSKSSKCQTRKTMLFLPGKISRLGTFQIHELDPSPCRCRQKRTVCQSRPQRVELECCIEDSPIVAGGRNGPRDTSQISREFHKDDPDMTLAKVVAGQQVKDSAPSLTPIRVILRVGDRVLYDLPWRCGPMENPVCSPPKHPRQHLSRRPPAWMLRVEREHMKAALRRECDPY